jgi:hypothetical protein
MRGTKLAILLAVGIGIAAGFALGWWLSPGKYRHFYRTTKELEIADDKGVVIGKLPAGTPLVSDSTLFSSSDFGWWGYAPVYFHSMDVAMDLGVRPGADVTSIRQMPLNVVVDFERLYRESQSPQSEAGPPAPSGN